MSTLLNPTGPTGPAANLTVTAPVTLPANFTIASAADLIKDLAVAMQDETTILAKHNITQAQFDALKKIPYFSNLYTRAVEDWNKPDSTQARIALQSAAAIEQVIPTVAARMGLKSEPLRDVIEAGKWFAGMAGLLTNAPQKPATERFVINIDLGADTRLHFDKARPVVDIQSQPSGESTPSPLPAHPQTEGMRDTVQRLIEATGSTAKVQTNPQGSANGLPV